MYIQIRYNQKTAHCKVGRYAIPEKGNCSPKKRGPYYNLNITEKQPNARGPIMQLPEKEPQPRETWTEIHTERPQKATIRMPCHHQKERPVRFSLRIHSNSTPMRKSHGIIPEASDRTQRKPSLIFVKKQPRNNKHHRKHRVELAF